MLKLFKMLKNEILGAVLLKKGKKFVLQRIIEILETSARISMSYSYYKHMHD